MQSSTIKKFEKFIKLSALGPSDAKLSQYVYGRILFRNKAICISPIKGLSSHMTEGVMTPQVDWQSLSEKYIDDMEKNGLW